MTDIIEELIGGGNAPPWLSGPLKEARDMAYYAKLVAAIFAVLALLGGLINLLWLFLGSVWVIVNLLIEVIIAVILVFVALNIQRKIINAIDQNRIAQAKNDITIWMILGIIFGLIPGILLLLSKMKLDEATATPQYNAPGQAPPAQYNYGQQQPGYQQGAAQQQYGPQGYQQPAQQPAYGQPQPAPQPQYNQPPASQQPQQQYQAPPQPVGAPQPSNMDTTVICPNCGAQIPPYMHTCPKCGAPRPGTQL